MSRLKVLVVDDEPSLLRMLNAMLEGEGYEVLLASDGQTALHRISEDHPDVVLLDVMMPVLDGWGVLEALRGQSRRPRVICLSAKESRRDRLKGWKLGADEYVTKPVDVDRLAGLIPEVARRTEAEQEQRRREALEALGSDVPQWD